MAQSYMDDIFGGFRIQSEVSIFEDNKMVAPFPNDNFRIMIIDGNVEDIQMFEDLLNADGRINFSLSKWTNANQAINFLKNEISDDYELRPHLVMLDPRMPEMDGEEVLRQLKEEDIAIIVHSSMSNIQNVIEVAQLGTAAFFQKPLFTDAFVDFLKGGK